jgi:hypothetical protein
MRKLLLSSMAVVAFAGFTSQAWAGGVGNPNPGVAHDNLIFHVMKGENGPKQCNGGHSLFLRHFDGVIPETVIRITMVDWNQVDTDMDGLLDEDPVDGIDNDGDGWIDEDPKEPGAETSALDCDAWGDGELAVQMRDTDPRPGYVSTQEWHMRLIGRPGENFAFTTFANQTVSCTVSADPDGIPNSGDETVECTSGEQTDWVELAAFNLAQSGCVKQVKLGGKNNGKGGGKTQFCDITDGFLVDVDSDGEGGADSFDDFVFSISCLDNPDTLDVDESLFCPLSSLIWDVDEGNTTSQAKAQVFVGHTGSAKIKGGKIK